MQGKKRKRALEACTACRARKVRCDVMDRLPCMRCQFEEIPCITASQNRQINSPHPRAIHQQQNDDLSQATRCTFPPQDLLFHSGQRGTNEFDLNLNMDFALPADLHYWHSGPSTPQPNQEISHLLSETLTTDDGNPFNWTLTRSSSPDCVAGLGICKLAHLGQDEMQYLNVKNVLQLPPKEVQDSLVDSYFLYVHPFLPIVKEKEFREDYQNGLVNTSFLLYRAMICAATSYMSPNHLELCGFTSIGEAQEAHFTRAKVGLRRKNTTPYPIPCFSMRHCPVSLLTLRQLLYDFDTEKDILPRLQATLLFSFWAPYLSYHASRVNVHWLGLAIVMAKQLGMHRSAGAICTGNSLGRRIWWSCVWRDILLASTYRRPPMIHTGDYSVNSLSIEDALDGLEGSAAYTPAATKILARMFVRFVDLAVIASQLLESRYAPRQSAAAIPKTSSNILADVLDVECLNSEFKMWRYSFLTDDFSYLDSEESTYHPLMLHRNFILIVYNGLLIVANQPRRSFLDASSKCGPEGLAEILTTSWQRTINAACNISTLIKELIQLGLTKAFPVSFTSITISAAVIHTLVDQTQDRQSMDHDSPIKICIYALDAIKQRFPPIEDYLRTLDAITKLDTKSLTCTMAAAQLQSRAQARGQISQKALLEFSNIFSILNFYDICMAVQGALSEDGLPNELLIRSIAQLDQEEQE